MGGLYDAAPVIVGIACIRILCKRRRGRQSEAVVLCELFSRGERVNRLRWLRRLVWLGNGLWGLLMLELDLLSALNVF